MTIEEVQRHIAAVRERIHATNDPASAHAVLELIDVIEAQQAVIALLCARSARCRDAWLD